MYRFIVLHRYKHIETKTTPKKNLINENRTEI